MKIILPMITFATVAGVNFSNAQTQTPETPAPVMLNVENVAYGQNFDTPDGLSKGTGDWTQLPSGWAFTEIGTSSYANGNYIARAGSAARAETYSYGVDANADDRAFGSITGSNSGQVDLIKIGARFQNNTGKTITQLLIQYFGEQWRIGGVDFGKLKFAYSLDATDLNSGTWTPVTSLDFTSIKTSSAVAGINGNQAANRQKISGAIVGLTIVNGETFWIRWENNKDDSKLHGLAIDDFFITPNPGPSSISLTGSPYIEDVTYPSGLQKATGDHFKVPSGWAFLETGTTTYAEGYYIAREGAATRPETYSFGADGSDDRAFGSITGGTSPTDSMTNVKIGAQFINNTGDDISKLTIDYVGEQWRIGSEEAGKLKFAYSTDATDLVSGTWTAVTALDFISPQIGAVSALDGNDAANRQQIIFSISGLSISNGATFWIRWENDFADSKGHGLAIDDFSLTVDETLPVTLGAFNYKKRTTSVEFNWKTISENNNDYFELLRSADGTNFKSIGSVRGKGTRSEETKYFYIDFNPLGGISYYQLKQVDYNGEVKLYPAVSVNFGEKTLDFNVSKTESGVVEVNIYSPDNAVAILKIVSIQGYEISRQEVSLTKGANTVKAHTTYTVPGVGVAILSSGSSIVSKKIIIQ